MPGQAIRDRVLDNPTPVLELFEKGDAAWRHRAVGGDGARSASRCRHRAEAWRKKSSSRSRCSEEAQLNVALTVAGVEPVETDLGEYHPAAFRQ